MWKYVVVDQTKIALSLVQNWICEDEVKDLKEYKNFKTSPCQKNLISNPFQQILLKK